MRESLTARQQQVLEYITTYHRSEGTSPTLAEIAQHLGVRALSSVHQHVRVLERRGFLVRPVPRSHRGIELTAPGDVARPSAQNDYAIPAGARYVPVSALPDLFREWQRRRQGEMAT